MVCPPGVYSAEDLYNEGRDINPGLHSKQSDYSIVNSTKKVAGSYTKFTVPSAGTLKA
jgi:hypothetical protein